MEIKNTVNPSIQIELMLRLDPKELIVLEQALRTINLTEVEENEERAREIMDRFQNEINWAFQKITALESKLWSHK